MGAIAGSASHGETWMTPSVSNAQGNAYTRDRGEAGAERLTLAGQASQWPTPTASLMNDSEAPESWQARANRIKDKGINGNGAGMPLTIAVKAWPTPTSTDGGANSNRTARGNVGANLQERAQQWPTPTAQDSEQAGGSGTIARGKRGHSLNSAVMQLWPTPASRDYRSPNAESYQERGGGSKGEQLQNYVAHRFSLLPDPTTPGGEPSLKPFRASRLRLNPVFGAWLMGWPSTWTIAEPHASSSLATEWWRSRLQQHLSSLLAEPAGAERLAA
jgi:hypothetical protein